MIVGVTGYFCAGKDTFAEFAERKGFAHVSLSDMIREEIRSRGERVTIPRLTAVGTELRAAYGPQILAQRALDVLPCAGNAIVTSIRNPAEVEMLRTRPDFVMVFVDAPRRLRFERSARRARKGDPLTLKDFEKWERAQMRSGDPNAQQLLACKQAADIVVRNDAGVDTFHKRIASALRRIFLEFSPPRPTWDEYFMEIARVAASRANCVKRHIGAVITVDKQIVSTGYNGTPKGIKNCNEAGCPRCINFADSGTRLDECLCVHAEENAIVQAACNGISIKGGVLYTTFCPCSYCAKSIVNAGIAEVVYSESYAMDDVTRKLLREGGIRLRHVEPRPPRSSR